ncbi:FlgN protein [Alkalithermobacter thermoalcaliphilus JW-YL-7 = DSM 7308]|uniref:FlgN family protein n=1 Tax=Alkalithermobacter thermoalcaliphilus JW-YL-7 = DSM 7308 TaxID=1121328 RepID=A0A150FN86_CLOPD|nr:FlgN family protein [[Clostridium] paradoxum JW-YL-7 = DSM 7308]SHL06140.1 FlgN protein [[Clostridium] paradoxum JW-YL-7 = DSM 7308]
MDKHITTLMDISEKKHILLLEIYELTKLQESYIKNEDDNSLLDIIQKKQTRIDEINDLDKQFYDLYSKLKKELGVDSLEDIKGDYPKLKKLKNIVSDIMFVLEKISILEKENEKKLKIEMDKIKTQMKSINTTIKANKGYNTKYNYVQGIFVDNKK